VRDALPSVVRLALTTLATLLLGLCLAALELHFVDVGQGDAVVIVAPDRRAVVYDGGPDPEALLRYLSRLDLTEVVLVVASHPHADHIAGLPAVLDAFRPRFVLDNGLEHTTRTFERYLAAVERSGAQLLEPVARTITLGEVRLYVLPSPGVPAWDHNDNSVGLVIVYGDFRASLTGDAEERLFDWWLATVPERFEPVQVHKASHHGSVRGDTAAALARLRPQVVVVSAGRDNPYGHPHIEALHRYADFGALVYRTDRHGTVVVVAEPDGSYRVETEISAPPSTADPAWAPGAEGREGAPPRAAAAYAGDACIDLDTASLERLQEIVHIGPERAAEIVRLRPWSSLEALRRIDGIGPARLRDIVEQGLACLP
jgi:competence protein ComEC